LVSERLFALYLLASDLSESEETSSPTSGRPFPSSNAILSNTSVAAHLILSYSTDNFYLEISISVVQSNSVRPIKDLCFLGWCIIDILGTVMLAIENRDGADIANTALLQDQGIYFYAYDAPDAQTISHASMTSGTAALRYAMDPEASNISTSHGSVQARAPSFKESLVDRDASCIFTNAPPLFFRGTHYLEASQG
jgi:hypothetical protein